MNAVLGVSGSVAAYRAADLARELMRNGFTVRVCLTDSAQKFVQPALFEALTGNPCLIEAFEEPERGRMAHIDWARQADIIIIAPATANTINKIAQGIADDMLSTITLATTKSIVIAPAMNPQMYANEVTQQSLEILEARGAYIVEPEEGDVACGENGQGKLASISSIIFTVNEVATTSKLLKGKKILITSGPTQEPIDDVRFITNRSSGKMGVALAKAALLMGAEVTVIAGPQEARIPLQLTVIRVKTALDMLEAMKGQAPQHDWIIGAAAVADYRLENPSPGKLRRSESSLQINLVPNPDIIAEAARLAPNAKVIGFAAEPSSDLSIAKEKIRKKSLFAIAANDVGNTEIGFDSSANAIDLIFADGNILHSGVRSKFQCAVWLLESIAQKGS
ncbi:MAG: bifunctional phosphopantothenoylcysteine decarboxylase/phosphopantothenate--cysteine ligase CoaBC [Fimbriimonadaceae bacterium]|nr:bifunctional phosphopantothenoylcysteine decarboxylase/phosphopantothenate--cysteine ligase CoaBC [Fimbriimonadaceae bacterium]